MISLNKQFELISIAKNGTCSKKNKSLTCVYKVERYYYITLLLFSSQVFKRRSKKTRQKFNVYMAKKENYKQLYSL